MESMIKFSLHLTSDITTIAIANDGYIWHFQFHSASHVNPQCYICAILFSHKLPNSFGRKSAQNGYIFCFQTRICIHCLLIYAIFFKQFSLVYSNDITVNNAYTFACIFTGNCTAKFRKVIILKNCSALICKVMNKV